MFPPILGPPDETLWHPGGDVEGGWHLGRCHYPFNDAVFVTSAE